MSARPVFRLAPSPNGHLHLGHAYSALYTQARCREAGGRLLLRLEDIDLARCSDALVRDMIEDLRWLGLDWEEPVRRQSRHLDDYAEPLGRLDEMGLLYPCFATRREIADAVADLPDHPRDPDGSPLYPGLCRAMAPAERDKRLAAGIPHALRLDMAAAIARAKHMDPSPLTFTEPHGAAEGGSDRVTARPEAWGDVILARKDVRTSYHIAVVWDDALQGVTHVTRGKDLFHATSIHRLLQRLLGLPEPLYDHHDLVRDEDGRRLSKSARDKSIRALRAEGCSRMEVLRMAGADGLAAP